jgi:hypothetical protein
LAAQLELEISMLVRDKGVAISMTAQKRHTYIKFAAAIMFAAALLLLATFKAPSYSSLAEGHISTGQSLRASRADALPAEGMYHKVQYAEQCISTIS